MRAFLSRHVFASIFVGVALGFALGWLGADRIHASGVAALASVAALQILRRRGASGGLGAVLPSAPEVQASDAAEDSAGAEAARSAREDAEVEAGQGWASERTRKLPGFEPLILAWISGALALVPPNLGTCQESAKNGPSGPEAVSTATEIGPVGCLPLTGPFPPAVPGAPPVGFWTENGKGYICPCFTTSEQFGEVTMLPGGCRVPDALPLIALRLPDWAFVVGGIEQSNATIRALRSNVETARSERDRTRETADALAKSNAHLTRERDSAKETLLSGIGAGVAAGALITGLIAFLAVN